MKHIRLLLPVLAVIFFCSFAAEWIDFQSKEGRFKMKFPRQPEESTQDFENTAVPLQMHMFIYDASKYKDDNMAYYIMYCDYPDTMVSSDFKDELLDGFFKTSINAGAKNMKGNAVSILKVAYKEFPGRLAKIKFMNGQGICYMKMFLVHSRVYMLMTLCEPQKDKNPAIDKFLTSFVLLDEK